MYRYLSVHTDCYSNTWDTRDIEEFIESKKILLKRCNGGYKGIDFYCDMQLVLVKSWDSWSSNDYDNVQTNYISIIVEDDFSNKRDIFLKEFSEFLGWNITEEV